MPIKFWNPKDKLPVHMNTYRLLDKHIETLEVERKLSK